MNWTDYKLAEISTNIQTGPFGSQLHQSDYSECGTPVVMPKDLIAGHISEDSIARVSEDHVERLSRHKIEEGDILYSRRGEVGRCAYAGLKEVGWLCGTGCLRVSINAQMANSKYVFYQLQKAETVGWVVNHAVGATMLNLNTSILSDVPVKLPSLEIQNKTVRVLSAYDDLIENNQKQIKLLEEAAQRLYKEWFVDLRFPGYEDTEIVEGIPAGWKIEEVGKLIRKVPRTTQILTANYHKTGQIPIIDQSKTFIAGYTDDETALVDLGEPVIVFGDHTRILKYIQFPFAKGADGTQLIVSTNKNMPQSLLYCGLVNIDLSNYHYARHFKYLKAESLIVPAVNIAKQFDRYAGNLLKRMQVLRDEISSATEARDRLLPKLISGEIEL